MSIMMNLRPAAAMGNAHSEGITTQDMRLALRPTLVETVGVELVLPWELERVTPTGGMACSFVLQV
jgi:hypothetical protein